MKKPNIKALAVDHGEKFIFGFFAVIVLGVLASTSWARYAKSPDELKKNVENARNKISSSDNAWPKAEEESYKVVNFTEKSRLLFAPLASLAAGRYDLSTPLYHPLYRKDEPKREPIYEAVQYLITKSGLAPLSMMTEAAAAASQMADDSIVMTDEKPAVMENGEFDERPVNAPAGAGAMPGGKGNGPHAGPAKGGAAAHGAGAAGGIFANMPGGMMPGGGGVQGPDVKALGVRYIAVRGVFPLRKQIENFKRALHLTEPEAASLVELMDFVLERQVAQSGSEPWKDADWKQVSITTAEQILDECSDLDPLDPVPTALKDPVITMNLPLRLLFTWGESATHPKIKDEELKKDEIAMEDKLLETAEQALKEANLGVAQQPKKGGFAKHQTDLKQMVNQIRSSPEAMSAMRQMATKMPMNVMTGSSSSAHGGGHGAGRPMGAAGGPMGASNPMMMGPGGMRGGGSVMDRLVVNSRYLLFRYLDFDVESGLAYRYRVRLVLRNPNFELSPEELGSGDVEITKGPTRETPWSNISNPEVVPSTVNFFLAKVEREPYHEEKVRTLLNKPVAEVQMFDWDTKLGTTIREILNIPAIGAFIEERKETMILDLAAQTLEKEKRKIATMNVLVDVEADVEVAPDQHPDLKLAVSDKKRGTAWLGLLPEAMIAMESGEIEAIDPLSDKADEQVWIRRTEFERKGIDGVKKATTSRLDDLTGGANSADPKATKSKKKNVRRNMQSAASSPDMMQQQMQQQMMMQAGGAGAAASPPGNSKKKR